MVQRIIGAAVIAAMVSVTPLKAAETALTDAVVADTTETTTVSSARISDIDSAWVPDAFWLFSAAAAGLAFATGVRRKA
ncbi:MAG: hypothetical protein AAGC77_11670 [Pseudomonadota bacterium]